MRPRLIVLLSAIGGFLPLVTDGFLPAMRPMMVDLGANIGGAQLTISLALAGFAIAQLIVGVVADRFGRRPVLLAATAVFTVASIGAAAASSLAVLLVFRFLQGFSAAAGPVLMRAVVRDLCSRVEGARVLSFVGMGMGAVPLAIPALNSQVTVTFGWRAALVVYVVYLAAVLWMMLAWLDETLAAPDPQALSPRDFWRAVRRVLGHPQALGYMLCCVFGYGGLAVWISSAPHLLLGYFHQAVGTFGLWWAIPVTCYVLGGYLSARGLRKHSSDALLRTGSIVALLASGLLIVLQETRPASLAGFIIAIAIYHAGWAIVQPHGQAGALSYFPDLAGRVSAVLGFLQMLGGAAIGLAFGRLHDGTPRAAAYLIGATALAGTVARVGLATRPRLASERESL